MQILACLRERRARVRLQRALGVQYAIAWAGDWDEIDKLVRRMAVDVIVVDPRSSAGVAVASVRRLRERYPSVPTVIYTEFRTDLAAALLEWGDVGVCGAIFIDQSDAAWDLRRLVRLASERSAAELLLQTLQRELPGLDEKARHLLRVGLYKATTVETVEEWGQLAGLPRRKLYRLFSDAGLPTPKTCLQWLRLLYVANALSDPGVSVEDVVFRMRYSAPSNFGAHTLAILGVSPSEMRWSVTAESIVDRFASLCRDQARASGSRVADG